MSVSNARTKPSKQSSAKKNAQKENVSAVPQPASNIQPATNAVYPIVRTPPPKTVNAGDDVVTTVAAANGQCSTGNCGGDRPSSQRYARGQCVHPRPATEPRIAATVVEFVSEVIPQSSGAPNHIAHEAIQWVRIQKCALDAQRRKVSFVVVVGLERGYQLWVMLENGTCEEVVSERRGPLRVGHLVTQPSTGPRHQADAFAAERPLFAIVDGNPMSPDAKFCTVNFTSLRTGHNAHTLKFNEPVLDVSSTGQFVVVALADRLIVHDNATLAERYSVVVPSNRDPALPPVYALADCFLAYHDCSLNPSMQSAGGRIDEEDLSYSGQSISKTVTSIGESLVSSFTATTTASAHHHSQAAEKRPNAVLDPGVVTVVDVSAVQRQRDDQSNANCVAHFVAHRTGLSHLAFGNGGRLLFTSNEISNTFNLFLLHPHPLFSRLGAAQHIYTLHRGNSAAKVIETAFTPDNRWLAVATNHGTTHVFAITPYGGPVTLRTHGGRFVNRESRFERTAGLASEPALVNGSTAQMNHKSATFVEHPAMENGMLARAVVNPRLTRYPAPVVLWSQAKIKPRLISAEGLASWASDNSPLPLNSSNYANAHHANPYVFESNRRLALVFGTAYGERCATSDAPILHIMGADGMLYQHKIQVRRERLNSNGSISSLSASLETGGASPGNFHSPVAANSAEGKGADAPVKVKVNALSQWSLTRGRGTTGVDFISPPLPETSPILRSITTPSMAPGSDGVENPGVNRVKDENWLQQVELNTYIGPHRRMWMGPQFSFGVYNYTGHSSAELVPPSAAQQPLYILTSQKSYPVLVERNSSSGPPSSSAVPVDDTTTRILSNVWTSGPGGEDPLASVIRELEDAMRDDTDSAASSPGSRHASATPSSAGSAK